MKSYPNLEIMQSFKEKNLPDLDICTKGALELFTKEGLPKFNFPKFKNPIIIGSGNAKVTAQILFANQQAIFADENNYRQAIKRNFDGAIIFSASGEKHAPIIAKELLKNNIKTYLLTCNSNSFAGKMLTEKYTIITNKNPEPYTYNTSTYLGWILSFTKEDPQKILDFIEKKIQPLIPNTLKNYNGFLLVTPNEFEKVNLLFNTKFVELFGRQIAKDVVTYEELKHAITVVPSKTELCIKFGSEKINYLGNILEIPLPKNIGPAMMMAIGYYVIGQIQKQKPKYFKNNINKYIQDINNTTFGKGLRVIVK